MSYLEFEGHTGNKYYIHQPSIISISPSIDMGLEVGEEILVRCQSNVTYTGPLDGEINQRFMAYVSARLSNRIVRIEEPPPVEYDG